jgi:hypothetical protein
MSDEKPTPPFPIWAFINWVIALVIVCFLFVPSHPQDWWKGAIAIIGFDFALLAVLLVARDSYRVFQDRLRAAAAKRKQEEDITGDPPEWQRGASALQELTEWCEKQRAILVASVKNPEALDAALLLLEQRYDELLKERLREMRP